MENLSPRPWRIQESSTGSNNGSLHIYLVDANGRKIAALWGKMDEKLTNGVAICELINYVATPP